ncbi:hypothetical protein [Archangium sp.]|uniref:hypothetical protein n=1 Tax=Archangium sp. TaxID=1872627 RepID=UPI003899A235
MKKELVSFNEVERDLSSLLELDDEALETVVGGYAAGDGEGCIVNYSPEPGCNTLC